MCRVKRGGDESGVDGGGYEFFQGAGCGKIECGEEVFVGES